MATRTANLTPAHEEAFDIIDVAFYGANRKSKAVVEACKAYLEHQNRLLSYDNWQPKKLKLFVDLLQKMASSLGYDLDKVSIEHTSYFSVVFNDTDW